MSGLWATVSVMGQQFNDGTIERRAYLEGPVMEDRAMDARQAQGEPAARRLYREDIRR